MASCRPRFRPRTRGGFGLLTVLSAAAMLAGLGMYGPAAARGGQAAIARRPAPAAGCVACHGSREDLHVRQWEASLHARAGVGCPDCHGGDPGSADMVPGHGDQARGRAAVACEACHAAVAAAWRGSGHAGQFSVGRVAPSCIECHGWMGGILLSGDGLRERCAACHPEDGAAGSAWVPGKARDVLDLLARVGMAQVILTERVARLRRRDVDVARAEEALRVVRSGFQGVAVEWHRFALREVEARGRAALARLEEIHRDLGD